MNTTRTEKLLQYLEKLQNMPTRVSVLTAQSERIEKVCDAIEKELGIEVRANDSSIAFDTRETIQ